MNKVQRYVHSRCAYENPRVTDMMIAWIIKATPKMHGIDILHGEGYGLHIASTRSCIIPKDSSY